MTIDRHHANKLRAAADHIETHGYETHVISVKTGPSEDTDLDVHLWDVQDDRELRVLLDVAATLSDVTTAVVGHNDTVHVSAVGTMTCGYRLRLLVILDGSHADMIRANAVVGDDFTPIPVGLLRSLSDARVAEAVTS